MITLCESNTTDPNTSQKNVKNKVRYFLGANLCVFFFSCNFPATNKKGFISNYLNQTNKKRLTKVLFQFFSNISISLHF